MALWRDTMLANLIRDFTGRIDEDLPPYMVRSMSVDVEEFRLRLASLGHAYVRTDAPTRPDLNDLNRSANATIKRYARKASVVGAAGGVAGYLGVPPEVAARLVQSVRLAQRLAIIYGHDPTTDKGGMHVRRALAAGWEFELPAQSKVDIRLSDLPTMVRTNIPTTHHGGGWLARTLVQKAATSVNTRFVRAIPGLGVGVGAFQAHRNARKLGQRMHETYIRSYRLPKPTGVEDAIEV